MWETLEEAVDSIVARWTFLLRFFELTKMCEGVDAKQHGFYTDIAAIINDTELRPRLEVLLVVAKTIGRRGGCWAAFVTMLYCMT
jgi:hypothetical protein